MHYGQGKLPIIFLLGGNAPRGSFTISSDNKEENSEMQRVFLLNWLSCVCAGYLSFGKTAQFLKCSKSIPGSR